MSEPIPESIPTSQDPRSKRPLKRRALTPTTQQATELDALFAKPDREIALPASVSSSNPRNGFLAPPPEIVANVQGSSAGAGSGEFHVYKASRRREYERLRLMDEEVRQEKENEEYSTKNEERRKRDEAKTNKNKARREKLKAKKGKAGGGKVEGIGTDLNGTNGKGMEAVTAKGKPSVRGISSADEDEKMATEAAANPEEIGVVIHDDD